MNNKLNPGQTVGLIGVDFYTEELSGAFKAAGYRVKQLSPKDTSSKKLIDFAKQVDRLICADFPEDPEDLDCVADQLIQDTLPFVMAQDRLLFKNFLDEANINTQPYATILSEEDVYENVKSIGFPCALRSNQGSDDLHLIYEASEIADAFAQLPPGPAILEAWIPLDTEIALTISRSISGHLHIVSLFEVVRIDTKAALYITVPRIEAEWLEACEEVGRQFVNELRGAGLFTLRLLMTSTGVIYVHHVKCRPELNHYPKNMYGQSLPLLEQVSIFTDNQRLSASERQQQSVVILPIYKKQVAKALELVSNHPQMNIQFYHDDWLQAEADEKVAEVSVVTEHITDMLSQMSSTFFHESL
ncbi:ATP-grasp domain-containing protein [Allofustis seminis]|uniref:ATP-grasp domain-containing protein n=1 Tax=Allofustis seminis TaxID=166939 RepID=UPI00035D9B46|nr:ATP-grasp domain-containing protein [Allofustis seminis]